MGCELCPRRCGVDRIVRTGACHVTQPMRVGKIMLHQWEEPCISGTRGSGAIFFAGCGLGCVYCQNYALSRGQVGQTIDPERLAEWMQKLEEDGAQTLNLVTATQYLDGIERALGYYRTHIPIVYNCGGYERVETVRRIADWVDVWLPDWKYSDSDLAAAYSHAPDYPQVARQAICEMRRLTPENQTDQAGILQRGLLIRHLVLPGAVDNTRGVLDAIAAELGTDTVVSLMGQYVPPQGIELPPQLRRKLKPLEYKIAWNYAWNKGFRNVWVQDAESADAQYTPIFDGTYSGAAGISKPIR